MLTLLCECGETYYSDERNIGRKITCKRCGRVVQIERRQLPVPVKKAAVVGGVAIGGGGLWYLFEHFPHVFHALKSLWEICCDH
jgi:hypothetical protein